MFKKLWSFIFPQPKPIVDPEIKNEVDKLTAQLESLYNQWDMTSDPDIIDYIIHQISSLEILLNKTVGFVREKPRPTPAVLPHIERRLQDVPVHLPGRLGSSAYMVAGYTKRGGELLAADPKPTPTSGSLPSRGIDA
jgi:hypothetical protein